MTQYNCNTCGVLPYLHYCIFRPLLVSVLSIAPLLKNWKKRWLKEKKQNTVNHVIFGVPFFSVISVKWKRAQRWDRKVWSYRQVSLQFVGWYYSLKQDLLFLFSWLHREIQFPTLACAPQFQGTVIARLHVISCTQHDTVSHWLCIVIRNFSRRNLPLSSVLYNIHWRLRPLMKNVDWQWRNVWCLMRRYATPVTSQVPFFRLQHLM